MKNPKRDISRFTQRKWNENGVNIKKLFYSHIIQLVLHWEIRFLGISSPKQPRINQVHHQLHLSLTHFSWFMKHCRQFILRTRFSFLLRIRSLRNWSVDRISTRPTMDESFSINHNDDLVWVSMNFDCSLQICLRIVSFKFTEKSMSM